MTRSMRSGRPEWPIVTRVTIATSMPPKKPMPSAWIGARPSAHSPVSAKLPSRAVCSSTATGSQAKPAYSVHSSGLPRARSEVQRTAHQAVSTNRSAASTTGSSASAPAVPSSRRAYAERHDGDEDPGRAPRHVVLDHALREERDHAVADREEDRQQAAPQRGPHREVQREVVRLRRRRRRSRRAPRTARRARPARRRRATTTCGAASSTRNKCDDADQQARRPSAGSPRAARVAPLNVAGEPDERARREQRGGRRRIRSAAPAGRSSSAETPCTGSRRRSSGTRRTASGRHGPRSAPGCSTSANSGAAVIARARGAAPTRRWRRAGSSRPAKNSVRCGAAGSGPSRRGVAGCVMWFMRFL